MVSSAPPNVVHTTTFIDGTVSEKHPDGRVVQTSPDGSKIVTDANGKKTEYHSDGAVVEHNPAGSLPALKVKLKGPASASSPRGKTSIPKGTSNATASRPKETATASRPKETATASRPKETAKAMTLAADDDDDDFLENSDEIDSPSENAKTLYNILTDGTKALKFVNRREVDLTWRNPDDKSNTVLMMACKVGTPQIVKVLVDKKADVTYSNSRKTTPLHVACRRGHTQIAKILLDSKADPAACSKYGTPLYEAQKKSSKTSTQRKRDNLLKALSSRLQTT